jgi:DNA-binding transcriptional ArsR family regulator
MAADADAAVTRFADMLAAIGAESRLRIVRLLLQSHPDGMTAGELGDALRISASTLSHHLDRLKREEVIAVRREGTYLHYTANTAALEDLLRFLYAECCSGGCVVALDSPVDASAPSPHDNP